MSEQEHIFIERAEVIIKQLEKTRNWYKASSFTFFIATIALIGSIYLNNYRITNLEKDMEKTASRKGVELLSQLHKAEVIAIGNLIEDKDKKETLRGFQEIVKVVNDNIFMYSLGVTRGEKEINDYSK